MVGVAGFEPTTPSPPDYCANRAALPSDGALIGALAAARNVGLQRSASRRRRARMREDSLRLHNFGQRFAQRRKLVVRDPGMDVWRAGFFLSPGGRLSGVSGLLGQSNGR